MKLSSKLLPSIIFFFFKLIYYVKQNKLPEDFCSLHPCVNLSFTSRFSWLFYTMFALTQKLRAIKDAQAMGPSMKYLTRGLQDYSFSSTLKQRENENMEGNILDSNPLLSFVHPFPVYLLCFNIIAGTNQMFSTNQQVHSSLAFLCLLRSLLYTVVQYIRSRMQRDS